jgi:hypothetical protein
LATTTGEGNRPLQTEIGEAPFAYGRGSSSTMPQKRNSISWCYIHAAISVIRQHARILERQNVLQTGQVLFRRLCVGPMVVLPFKDSQGGTWLLNLFDFNWSCLCRHAPVKKQTQCANRAKAFAPHQNLGPPLARPLSPAASLPALSICRIPLAGLRRGLASRCFHATSDTGFPVTAEWIPSQMATVSRSHDPLSYRLFGQWLNSGRSAAFPLQPFES